MDTRQTWNIFSRKPGAWQTRHGWTRFHLTAVLITGIVSISSSDNIEAESRVSQAPVAPAASQIKAPTFSTSVRLGFVVNVPASLSLRLEPDGILQAQTPAGSYSMTCAASCVIQSSDTRQIAHDQRVAGQPQLESANDHAPERMTLTVSSP